MNTIQNKNLKNQSRESASLFKNTTGIKQPDQLFFVQFDDFYAVASDGCIYQIIDQTYNLNEMFLLYLSESGVIYNYAEDQPEFDAESEDEEIFYNCQTQAELLA